MEWIELQTAEQLKILRKKGGVVCYGFIYHMYLPTEGLKDKQYPLETQYLDG